jgi:uncharacterized protein YdaU (DUF1376 family)
MATEKSTRKLLAEWFWTDRWMGSSAFLLPLEPRGLYREMLTQAWNRGGALPNDHEAIRRAVGATPAEWRRCWPKVERFWRVEGDTLVNDTQLLVYADANAASSRAVERAKKAAQASAQARAQAALEQSTSSPQAEHKLPLKQSPLSPSLSPSLSPNPTDRAPLERARARTQPAGVMEGTLPRDHLGCRPPCIRVCISQKQHALLREKHGGADADLDEFYADVRARLDPSVPIGDTSWKFWDAQFAARFGAAAVVNPRTAGNAAAAARFIARGKS